MRQVTRIISRFWAITLCVGMLSSIPALAAFSQTEVLPPPDDTRCFCNSDYCQLRGGNPYTRWCCSGDTCGCTYITNC